MAKFSAIIEMIPGDATSQRVESVEAESMNEAWDKERARWYNSPLAQEHTIEKRIPPGVSMFVSPQIVDIKEGDYKLEPQATVVKKPEPVPEEEPVEEEPVPEEEAEEEAEES